MNNNRPPHLVSKFTSLYSRLLQGSPPNQISPKTSQEEFWSLLLSLDIEREFLTEKLGLLSKEDCLGKVKSNLNALVSACLKHARTALYDDVRKAHSLETLSIVIRCVMAKNLAGWEVMEVFAGGVSESDGVFMNLVHVISDILGSGQAPAAIRHQTVQLSLIFMCSINQLSSGAYFLRHDLFPSIAAFIKSPDTDRFTFEAALLLSLLANYHKSDAARLNPYLVRIKESRDKELFRKFCWAANYAADAAVKAYRSISDDSPPTMAAAFGSVLTSLRPDRVLASTPIDPPREIFKNQPIEAAVILLAIFEFVRTNQTFCEVLLEALEADETRGRLSPFPLTILTLSSYLFAHANSSSSQRGIAYANLGLHILLALVEKDFVMARICEPTSVEIWVCRQRPPALPIPPLPRAPVCALLDCCVLWLRHNLQKRLETQSYLMAVRICHRIVWFLQREHIRLEYHWLQLWKAVLGLLDFLANKLELMTTTGGVESLAGEAVSFLYFCLVKADTLLQPAEAVHEFVYELVRSSPTLKKQSILLQKLAPPFTSATRRSLSISVQPLASLSRLVTVVDFYQDIIERANFPTAKGSLRALGKEIDRDGLQASKSAITLDDPPNHSMDFPSFIRYACADGLSLM